MAKNGICDHNRSDRSRWMCYDGWHDRYFFTRKEDVLKKAYSLVKGFPYREDPIVFVYSVRKGMIYTSEGRVMKRLAGRGESIVYVPTYGKAHILTPSGAYRQIGKKPSPFGL